MKDKVPSPPDMEDLEEIKKLIGMDGDGGGENEDISVDDILAEYKLDGVSAKAGNGGKTPPPRGEKEAPRPAPVERREVSPAVKTVNPERREEPFAAKPAGPERREVSPAVKPVSPEQREDSPAAKPVSPGPQEGAPAAKPAPTAPADAEEDILRQIAMQVESALSHRNQEPGGVTVPRAVAERSAVKVEDEFEDEGKTRAVPRAQKAVRTDRAEESAEEAAASEPDTYRMSDDLRIFRGMDPADMAAKAKNAMRYYSWRCVAALLLALAAWYITTAPTYMWPLPPFISYIKLPYIYLFLLAAIQIVAMLISVSMLADGLRSIARLRFKAESLIAVASFIGLFHTVSIILLPKWGGFLPYTSVSILSLFFGLLTRYLRYRTVRYAGRSLALSGRQIVIRGVKGQTGRIETVYKTEPHGYDPGFLDMVLEEDASERAMRFYVPMAMVLSAVLAVITSFGTGNGTRFLWCLSALLSVSVPAGAMLSFVFPMSATIGRLSGSGATIAGYRGVRDLSEVGAAVVGERDLFPAKLVAVNNLRIFSDFTPDKVNVCLLSVLKASGSGLYDIMAASIPHVSARLPVAESFEFYETGGMGAYVGGDKVVVGTANFILRMGVRITEGINAKNTVFIAINSQFAGSFTVKYDAQPSVRRALSYMVRRRIMPVLAVRDFNITPQLVESRFKLGQECFGYPELEERIAYSGLKDSAKDDACAVMAVDNMVGYAELVSAGKRIHSALRLNMLLGGICTAVGMALVTYLLFTGAAASVAPFNVFYYLVLWFLPVLIASAGADRR